MGNIKIVEYKPSYAKATAEMWRKSSEGWNGFHSDETEESVLKQHEICSNINTYLAVDDDEVVGYCSFSEYHEDEGALYIPLLNVRFDCHGKGIGKKLVLKAVERTIEEGWPRLDLYTWPGNTKSVPLYKKCGFFFERRDDTTHLMNFIPTVLNTEAAADYFKEVDWYKYMKRNLDMDPDGREENGFDFYEYSWEKDEQKLRMEFERKGRGLRLIETEDYIIRMSASQQNLVFGQRHKVVYEVINKLGKPLDISIKGQDDKNIKFSFEKNMEVKRKEIIEAEFNIGEITEEFNEFKTHPAVISEVSINGKKALFKLGIVPEFPAKITLSRPNTECYKDTEEKLYIDIENNFNEEAVFEFVLPQRNEIKFHKNEFNIKMKAKEKTSVEVPFMLDEFHFYCTKLSVKALTENDEINFTKNVSMIFKGRNASFGGETDTHYVIVNGINSVSLSKAFNEFELQGLYDEIRKPYFSFPKLGKPYSEEFCNQKPENVEFYKEEDYMIIKAFYESENYKDINVISVIKLYQNGIVKHYYEIYNRGNDETAHDIWINQSYYQKLCKGTIPYDDKLIQISSSHSESITNVNVDKITENWVFSKYKNTNFGFCWNKNLKLKLDRWLMSLEYNLGKIPSGGMVVTEEVCAAIDTFHNWEDFRKFAIKENLKDSTSNLGEDFHVSINSGNPFVKNNFTVEVSEHRFEKFNGDIIIDSQNNSVERKIKNFNENDEVSEAIFNVEMKKNVDREIISLEADFYSIGFEKKALVFPVKNNVFESMVEEVEGKKVYSISNGIMEIKASSDFSPGIYSLRYNNHEWLENSFPMPRPKSWFNPWFGGIHTMPEELSFRSVLEEEIEAEFTSIRDNFDNEWQGIKVSVHVKKHKKFKGLKFNQYFLMLPGVPVLCTTTEIIQDTGKFMGLEYFETMNSFNIDEDIKNNWLKMKNRQGNMTKYKVGRTAMDIESDSSMLFGCNNIKDKIQMYADFNKFLAIGFVNINDTISFMGQKITASNNERIFMNPVFYCFTEEYIEDELLKDFRNIRFTI